MITILLEKIITILEGWIQSFTSHAQHVEDKLDSLDQTASDIETNTEPISDIADNTGAVVTPIQNIKSNTDSIKQNSQTSANNTTAILNNVSTLSTNTGRAAAFAENCANNTLEIKDKITTIASDTTQIRADHVTLENDLDKIYEAIKWSCLDIETTETESGASPLSFNTDKTAALVSLKAEIEGEQTGSGTPSPSNEKPISTYSNMVLTANGNNITISLGQNVFSGLLDVISGKLTLLYDFYTFNGTESWNVYNSRNGFWINTIHAISTVVSDNLCNHFIFSSSYGDFAIRISDNGSRYYFCNILNNMPEVTDIATWETWLSNNNVQIASKLVTPIEITLSPETINTITGDNTISINTNGNIEVTYKESVKHYLDKQDN